MIEVTESAQQKLSEYLKQNAAEASIRVFLAQGG
jgi:Fe-S cluster assembly iron-binding protein IscA